MCAGERGPRVVDACLCRLHLRAVQGQFTVRLTAKTAGRPLALCLACGLLFFEQADAGAGQGVTGGRDAGFEGRVVKTHQDIVARNRVAQPKVLSDVCDIAGHARGQGQRVTRAGLAIGIDAGAVTIGRHTDHAHLRQRRELRVWTGRIGGPCGGRSCRCGRPAWWTTLWASVAGAGKELPVHP